MAVIDLEGVFQRANARVLAMLGMTREQFQPVSCRSLTHPDEQAHIAEDFQALLQGQLTSVEGERPYDLADGRALWVRRSAALVRDPAGQPLYFLVQVQDVTAEREALTELRRLAYTDDLPGLGNGEQLRVTVDSRGPGCAVLLVDPDDFGRINDSFGRAAGDAVLVEVGRRISRLCRPRDLAVRLGGDEFEVLLSDADDVTAQAVCGRSQQALDSLIDVGDAGLVKVEATIGATTDATADLPLTSLLREADLAMHAGKAAGKRSSRLFEPVMMELSRRRMRLETELRHALRSGQLSLRYQPIVDLRTGRASGEEALCRWQHPVLGAVSPEEFMALAERSGLIDELTTWVLTEATSTVAGWDEQGAAGELSLAVNVSCSTAEGGDFADTVQAVLDRSGLAPQRLILEVTETGLVSSHAALIDTMSALHRVGVRFALDDFGTGYSCLARLAELPFSSLKLDRSFIAVIESSTDPAPLVQATVAMAAGLNMSMVAEGVETPAQLANVAAAGCRYIQGYLTGRPGTAEQVLELLRAELPPLSLSRRTVTAGLRQRPSLDIATVRQLLAELSRLVGVASTYLTRVDWATGRQELQVLHSSGVLALAEGQVVDWSDSRCRRVLMGCQPATCDVLAMYPEDALAAQLGLQSFLMAPVSDPHGNLYGTLCGASDAAVAVNITHLGTLRLFARLIGERLPLPGPE